jgi:hypothetical protein
MAQKIVELGIEREEGFMYFVRNGDVWRLARAPEGGSGRPELVADGGAEMDSAYIYFLDKEGDISRAKRAIENRQARPRAQRKSPAQRRSLPKRISRAR